MLQGQTQPNRLHPPERMCKDLRSMQLFAEQVLAHRTGYDPRQFRSYGFHEPNTDEGRNVFTIVDDRIYYFLPKLTPDAVHRSFSHLQQLVRDQFGRTPAIQQVVIVGESSTVDDRARLQEAVENYQFAATPPTPFDPTTNTPQATILPSATAKPITIHRALSYINEDPYWDPRQDDLGTHRDGLLHDRTGPILTHIHQNPSTPTVSPSPVTTLQSAETELQAAVVPELLPPVAPVPPADPLPATPFPNQPTNRDRRTGDRRTDGSIKGFLGNLANNLPALLGGISLLALALWFLRGGLNQPSNLAVTPFGTNPVITPPPPPGSTTTGVQTFQTGKKTVSSTQTTPRSTTTSTTTRPAVRVIAASPQPELPMAGFFARSPNPYDGVNLRAGPGIENRKIRGIPNGYWLVDEGRQIGTWREVSFQGQRGWVYRPFIR
jgi:hypothetical protein